MAEATNGTPAAPPEALRSSLRGMAAEAFARAAETMAFVAAVPLDEPGDAPPGALRVAVRFGGPVAGTLELAAPEAFGALLAANLLGPDGPPVPDAAVDALKELANVTCGVLLPELARRGAAGGAGGLAGRFEMGVPSAGPLAGGSAWSELASGGTVLDADGFKVAVRVAGAI